MTCCFCGRLARERQLPRGWKICDHVICCRKCHCQRFRIRSIRMTFAQMPHAEWQEFTNALDQLGDRATPLAIPDGGWEFTFVEGRRVVRLLIGSQWWALRPHDTRWCPGRKEAYAWIASGEVAAREFLLYHRPSNHDGSEDRPSSHGRPYEIKCKTLAWTAREEPENLFGAHKVKRTQPNSPDRRVRSQNIQQLDLSKLRDAIRANWVSFPSQVPIFPSCGQRALQHKIIQLYFVMGWSSANIADRYGLLKARVRDLLDAWKWQAANAGYLQHVSFIFDDDVANFRSSGRDMLNPNLLWRGSDAISPVAGGIHRICGRADSP